VHHTRKHAGEHIFTLWWPGRGAERDQGPTGIFKGTPHYLKPPTKFPYSPVTPNQGPNLKHMGLRGMSKSRAGPVACFPELLRSHPLLCPRDVLQAPIPVQGQRPGRKKGLLAFQALTRASTSACHTLH
jgi:hypothetical protein